MDRVAVAMVKSNGVSITYVNIGKDDKNYTWN